jgi:methionine-rich copper-binding protein CopC
MIKLIIPLIAALLAVGYFTMAEAHSRPVRFDPAPGTVLSAAPAQITGWFTSDIRRDPGSFIQVMDDSGTQVQTGGIQLSSDRRQMSVALNGGLGEGRYLVYWSTFDDEDGEVFSGCFTFFVGQAAADDAVSNGQALDGGGDCPAMPAEEAGHSHEEARAGENAPSIEISIPEEVDGNTATLDITPKNFTVRQPEGNGADPNFGHYHIFLDKMPDELITGEHSHGEGSEDQSAGRSGSNPGSLVENPLMWFENSYTFTNLEPGVHTVTVVLNYDNHDPIEPPVFQSATFHVTGGDEDGDDIPAWALALGIVGGLVVGGIGVKLVGSRA